MSNISYSLDGNFLSILVDNSDEIESNKDVVETIISVIDLTKVTSMFLVKNSIIINILSTSPFTIIVDKNDLEYLTKTYMNISSYWIHINKSFFRRFLKW